MTDVADSLQTNNYVFDISGSSTTDTQTSVVGLIRAANADGTFTGEEDRNDSGSIDAEANVTGHYVIDAGKGTATITDNKGTTHYRLYTVSDGEIEFLSLDPGVILSGDAQRQVATTPLGWSILAGNYVFMLSGETAQGDVAAAGRFSADGAGSITSGIEDRNSGSTIVSGRTFDGAYTVGADGRGEITVNDGSNSSFTFYVISGSESALIENDSAASSGTILSQTGDFSGALTGHFGFAGATVTAGEPVASLGTITADGTGGITGAEVVDDAGELSSELALTGTYSMKPIGRGTASIDANGGHVANYVLYGVTPQVFILLGVDPGTPAVGFVARQY